MKYQPYPKYKDSGVEWLGEVPEHWEVKRLKYLVSRKDEKVEADEENPLPYIGLEHIESWTGHLLALNAELVPAGVSNRFQAGDTLFGKLRPYLAKACNVDFEGLCSSELLVLRTNSQDQRFLLYRLIAEGFIARVNASTYGAKMPRASWDFIGNCILSEPPLPEQTAIANFLDRETAKIDTLIAKQQELIKLLQEKRQAVISHAVTKGLNPDVPMKDSGVEWLGEVPEHWEVRKIKYLFKILKRIVGELGYDVLSITQHGIRKKDIESGEGQLSMDYSKYQLVEVGDFAMNHMDLLTGFVDISKYYGVTSPDYRVFSLVDNNYISEYFLYLFQMGYLNKIFYAEGQGSSHLGRWRFPTEKFKSFVFPCPPSNEQVAIASFIKSEHQIIKKLIEKAEQAINLLKERRTALISAAVTGKIDVRNHVMEVT